MSIRTYVENEVKRYEVYVHGHDSRGQRIQIKRRGLETRHKAEKVEFELKRELAKRREEKVPYRWSEWFDECVSQMRVKFKPSTLLNYEKQLGKWISPRWKDLELREISKLKIHHTIFTEMDGRCTDQTKKAILKMVRRIFEMAVEEGALDRNPCSGIQVKVAEVEQKVLTPAEVEIFLRGAGQTRHRFYAVWVFALMTGMRSGEMFALQWADIDFEARIISVSKQWTNKNGIGPTKTQKNRVVPISDDLLQFLRELKLKCGNAEHVLPRLSEWENGEQALVTRGFCRAIGITPVKFHDLRATFITNLLARGVSLARVMAIVGHTEIKTTNGYLRKAGVDLKGVTNELGYRVPKESAGAEILPLLPRNG